MAYNVQFKKVLALPSEVSNHVFYAVYASKSAEGAYENLQKVYLGNVELSSVAVNALINTLDSRLAEEIARATAAEAVNAQGVANNKTAIEAEVARATAAEAANKAAIEAEVARATAAEAANTAKIDADIAALKENIGNLTNIMNFVGAYEALPTPLDNFSAGDVIIITAGENAGKEYVLNETDGVKAWVEIGHASATDAALAALAERVTALEGRMDSAEGRLTALETNSATKNELAALDTKLSEAIATEKTRAEGAEATLDARITSEVATLVASIEKEVSTLNTRIDTEVSTLNTRINTEVSTLSDRITTEVSTLSDRIDTEVSTLNTTISDNFTKIYGGADPDKVDLGKLVGAVNQLVDSANTSEAELVAVTTSVKDLDERVTATENLLTWEE